jgi:hypothetical protein
MWGGPARATPRGAARALQAAFEKGAPGNGWEMHVDTCWDPIRTHPLFIKWMKPKGEVAPRPVYFFGPTICSLVCTWNCRKFA